MTLKKIGLLCLGLILLVNYLPQTTRSYSQISEACLELSDEPIEIADELYFQTPQLDPPSIGYSVINIWRYQSAGEPELIAQSGGYLSLLHSNSSQTGIMFVVENYKKELVAYKLDATAQVQFLFKLPPNSYAVQWLQDDLFAFTHLDKPGLDIRILQGTLPDETEITAKPSLAIDIPEAIVGLFYSSISYEIKVNPTAEYAVYGAISDIDILEMNLINLTTQETLWHDRTEVSTQHVQWSPRGNQFIYQRPALNAVDRFDTELILVNTAGQETLIIDLNTLDASWSSDGTQIAFYGWEVSGGETNLYLYDVATQQINDLCQTKPIVGSIVWSPQANMFIYRTEVGFRLADLATYTSYPVPIDENAFIMGWLRE